MSACEYQNIHISTSCIIPTYSLVSIESLPSGQLKLQGHHPLSWAITTPKKMPGKQLQNISGFHTLPIFCAVFLEKSTIFSGHFCVESPTKTWFILVKKITYSTSCQIWFWQLLGDCLKKTVTNLIIPYCFTCNLWESLWWSFGFTNSQNG